MAGSPVGELPHAAYNNSLLFPIRCDSRPQAEADATDGSAEHRYSQTAIIDHTERVKHEMALVCVMKRVGTHIRPGPVPRKRGPMAIWHREWQIKIACSAWSLYVHIYWQSLPQLAETLIFS